MPTEIQDIIDEMRPKLRTKIHSLLLDYHEKINGYTPHWLSNESRYMADAALNVLEATVLSQHDYRENSEEE